MQERDIRVVPDVRLVPEADAFQHLHALIRGEYLYYIIMQARRNHQAIFQVFEAGKGSGNSPYAFKTALRALRGAARGVMLNSCGVLTKKMKG